MTKRLKERKGVGKERQTKVVKTAAMSSIAHPQCVVSLQCDQIWLNFATLTRLYLIVIGNFQGYLIIWQTFKPTLAKVWCYWAYFYYQKMAKH